MNPYVCNSVSASTFLVWDYCITFDDEVGFIWRQKWSWVTAVFLILRYVPIISSNLVIANIIAPFFPISNDSCVAWLVAYMTWTMVITICFETLLIVRVLALYENHRLLRYVLITLSVCIHIGRTIILALTIHGYKLEENVNLHIDSVACPEMKLSPAHLVGLYVGELLPETVFFLLAIIKLIHTKKTMNIPASGLLAAIVHDGTWAFALIFAFSTWSFVFVELSNLHAGIPFTWVVPVLGFTGSRLILNLRYSARTPPGGTSVKISDIMFASLAINTSDAVHENS